ncbi:outer membrane beta-barrel protein [Methylocystis sp. B8]|uniref:outer membrane protein n=1 Tax=Methylocystis sp. B8 TaxID=544938 RepID=UPI0010FDF42D|nr:outer membrane beta-barrel protein [Methylocystis sp. B8]TLG73975.1 porin family protein [Methylocystis sp. B8]
MKKILTALALVLTAGTALAADLPHYKAPLPPPPPPPPLWTGFYVGLNAGGTWANNNSIYVTNWPAGGAFSVANLLLSGSLSANNGAGFIGGGQIGYNWQFYNGSLVAGIEADIQGIAGSRGGSNSWAAVPIATITIGDTPVPINLLSNVNVRRSLDYLGTVRGRLGWLFTPTLLVYGTGGLAYGGVNVNVSNFQALTLGGLIIPAQFGAGSLSDTRVGWTAGGGIEWMFWPNWSAKAEYLYYDLGTAAGSAVNVGLAGTVVSISQFSTRFNGNIVRAGVNYHFNWGAPPVVAKY